MLFRSFSLPLQLSFPSLAFALCAGCSSPEHPREALTGSGGSAPSANGTGSSAAATSAMGGSAIVLPPSGGASGGATELDPWPSPNCKGGALVADVGEYCQGPAFAAGAPSGTLENASGCGTTLWGVARDFVGYNQVASAPPGKPHPDFGSHYCCGSPLGSVLPDLGADGKPLYNPANVAGDYTAQGVGLTSATDFAEWYRDTPDINLSYLVAFHLAPVAGTTTSVFSSKRYFPVDDAGFGNLGDWGEDGMSHNFGFTTELHTKFKYQGGEVFGFEGDDDLWVFIDKKLAIDLGGIHVAMPGEVSLDEFAAKNGLVIGQVYSLDLFNAERHPAGSNFKITTSMTFVDCGVNPDIRQRGRASFALRSLSAMGNRRDVLDAMLRFVRAPRRVRKRGDETAARKREPPRLCRPSCVDLPHEPSQATARTENRLISTVNPVRRAGFMAIEGGGCVIEIER